MGLKRLSKADIAQGRPLPWDACDSGRRLLLRKGAIVHSEDQLERLIELGLFSDAIDQDVATTGQGAGAQSGAANVQREHVDVFDVLDKLRDRLNTLLFAQPMAPDLQQRVEGLALALDHVCNIDSDAALASVILSRRMPYSARHACNCAVVVGLLCRQLDWPAERRLSIMAAALTMNLAMLDLQDEVYHQQDALDAAQKAIVFEHPRASAAILHRFGVSNEDWLSAVAQHHEAIDASGYPDKLRGDAITQGAQMLGLVDKYCAMTSERSYRDAMPADVALRQLLISHGAATDTALAARLIKEVGIYPPGTAVQLVNGEIGIVIKRTLDAKHPVIRAVLSSHGQALSEFPKRLTSKPAYAVKAAVARKVLGANFDPRPLWIRSVVTRDDISDAS